MQLRANVACKGRRALLHLRPQSLSSPTDRWWCAAGRSLGGGWVGGGSIPWVVIDDPHHQILSAVVLLASLSPPFFAIPSSTFVLPYRFMPSAVPGDSELEFHAALCILDDRRSLRGHKRRLLTWRMPLIAGYLIPYRACPRRIHRID